MKHTIEVNGIKIYAFHGCLPEETKIGGHYLVDVHMVTNFQKALQDGDTTNLKKVWIYQPSAGAGFKIKNIMLDYAFTNFANQSNPLYTHIFSLRFNIVGKKEVE